MLARYIAPVALLALAALPAHAQDSTAHPARAQDSTARPARAEDSTARSDRLRDTIEHPGPWLLGAGVHLNQGSAALPSFQFGREWRAPDSRFGLRLDASYDGRSQTSYSSYGADFQPLWSASESRSAASLSLLTTFALTKGRIQPYLISGFTLQRRFSRMDIVDHTNPGGLPGGGSLNFVPGTYRSASTELGAAAGIGIQARVGRAWVYLESRSQFTGNYRTGRNSLPVTLGIRF